MLFNMKQLLEFAKQTMERYPAIKSDVKELIELCKTSIQDLIIEYNGKIQTQ